MAIIEFGRKKKKELKTEPITPILKSMVDQLGYPYQILPKDLLPDEVMEIYKDAEERGRREGFTPVLMPEDDVLDEYFGILFKNDGYRVGDTLKEIGDHVNEILQKDWKDLSDPQYTEDLAGMLGEMKNGESQNIFVSLVDFGSRSMKPTVLLEVPTKNPWETVVYVPFGGWNECPEPKAMAAICKYWYEKYQAVPAVITHDTLEFLLPYPVKKEEAMEVAKERFLFCVDRVDQGTESGTIGEVADTLWRSRVWYFWWD